MPVENVKAITYQLLKALDKVEQAGVVHRDVKPRNLLVTKFGTIMVLDFGLAVWSEYGKWWGRGIRGDVLYGTPEYMAPEYLSYGFSQLSAKVDVWGAGITTVELLRGGLPFDRGPNTNIVDQHELRR
jgi:serine/threonine protein kinase